MYYLTSLLLGVVCAAWCVCVPVPPDLTNVHRHGPSEGLIPLYQFSTQERTLPLVVWEKHGLFSFRCSSAASWLDHPLSLQVLLIFKDSVRPCFPPSTQPAPAVPQLAIHLILSPAGASSTLTSWHSSFFLFFFLLPSHLLTLPSSFHPSPCSLFHFLFCLPFFPCSYLGQVLTP